MIKDLFKFKKAKAWLSIVKVAGYTINDLMFSGENSNTKNTIRSLYQQFKDSKKAGHSLSEFATRLDKVIARRNTATRRTLKNVMSAVRQEARSQFTTNIEYWENFGIFDSAQTAVCGSYMGRTWKGSWSSIPTIDKPPRTSTTYHECRSEIIPVKKGAEPRNQEDFITQFKKAPDETLKGLLRNKTNFEGYKNGTIKIDTVKDYEKLVLFKPKEVK